MRSGKPRMTGEPEFYRWKSLGNVLDLRRWTHE